MSALRSFFSKRRITSTEEVEYESIHRNVRDYSRFHVLSGDDPESSLISGETFPEVRSGHRIFVTDDYLYVIGGYDSINEGTIYKDVWRMNLLTLRWIRMNIPEGTNFPNALASFAMCQLAPYSNQIVLFGGTDLPFGEKSSDLTYLLTMNDDGTVSSEELKTTSTPRRIYGHAMVRDDSSESPSFYVVGGTTGRIFFLDIDNLSKDESNNWKWEKSGTWNPINETDPVGLYRLECIVDKGKLIMLGGGTPDYVHSFDKIYTFDLDAKIYGHQFTLPDPNAPNGGYPTARRCHSATQWGRKVVVAGGCSEDSVDAHGRRVSSRLYGDIWILDLDSFQWTKYHSNLYVSVFFHSAAVTKDGCLIIHGGVADERSMMRVNTVQVLWLLPPSLLHLTARHTFRAIAQPRKSSGVVNDDLQTPRTKKMIRSELPEIRMSRPTALVKEVLFS